MMGIDGEEHSNRVALRAVVCSRVTQRAHTPAHVGSCWHRAPLGSCDKRRQAKENRRTECARTVLIASDAPAAAGV